MGLPGHNLEKGTGPLKGRSPKLLGLNLLLQIFGFLNGYEFAKIFLANFDSINFETWKVTT